MKSLEIRLRELRDSGRKALVPYFMGGLTPDWTRYVEAAILAGADAVEIGVPFSDPMMDGVVIQEAARRAINAGTTLDSICADLERLSANVPLVAMTYYNVLLHGGLERSAGQLHASGVSGAIVPDLTLEEADGWRSACRDVDVATVFLVAPSTPLERIRRIGETTEGFAYASTRMAVTGPSSGASDGERVVALVREVTTVPTYLGIGIGSPAQASEAAQVSDGIIIGSALVQVILDGGGAGAVEEFLGNFREAIDA